MSKFYNIPVEKSNAPPLCFIYKSLDDAFFAVNIHFHPRQNLEHTRSTIFHRLELNINGIMFLVQKTKQTSCLKAMKNGIGAKSKNVSCTKKNELYYTAPGGGDLYFYI